MNSTIKKGCAIFAVILLCIILFVIILFCAFAGGFAKIFTENIGKGNYYASVGFRFTEYEDMVIIESCNQWPDAEIVEIPETIEDKPVTALDDGAFKGCDHTEIIIPDSVTYIGKDVFADCSEELKVYYDGEEVDPDELAKQLNEKPVPKETKKQSPWFWVAVGGVLVAMVAGPGVWIAVILILVVLVSVAVFAYRRIKKKNKKSEEQPIPPTANPLEEETKDNG